MFGVWQARSKHDMVIEIGRLLTDFYSLALDKAAKGALALPCQPDTKPRFSKSGVIVN